MQAVTKLSHQFSSFASRPSSFSLKHFTRCQTGAQSQRCIHQLRQLPYDIENGLGDFLSPEGLRMIAVDYQQGLLSRLNNLVRGTKMESQSVTDTVISTASQKEYALAFNYSSQALNNSFFLECLKPPPSPPKTNEDVLSDDYDELVSGIRTYFGDLSQLKSTFCAAAMGMINSGWVWLVCDEAGCMEVVATFGAGTLLVRSRQHMRTSDLPILGEPLESHYKGQSATRPKASHPYVSHGGHPSTSASSPTSGLTTPSAGLPPPAHARSFARKVPDIYHNDRLTPSAQAKGHPNPGTTLTPLLCCSAYEHAWVGTGYGVWGKEEYLKRFWTVVNWDRVNVSYNIALRNS